MFASLMGERSPVPVGVSFALDPLDAHNMLLTLLCDDGSSFVQTFTRNGIPVPGAVVEIPAAVVASAGASLHAHETIPKGKSK
jgi:hypothetical protein